MATSDRCRSCSLPAFRAGCCAGHWLTSGRPDASGRYRHRDLDLSGQSLADVTLERVTFDGETRFDRCEFRGEVRFVNCAFTGYVSFIESTAERLAFRDCRFTHIVNLTDTEFDDLSIRRSEFDAAVELELGPGRADIHLTTFSGLSRLVGAPRSLDLNRVAFPNGARLHLAAAEVTMYDVEFGAPSSLVGLPSGARPRLLAVADTDVSRLFVVATDLSSCSFEGAHNLDGIAIESLDAFAMSPGGPYARRRVLSDECGWRAYIGRGPRRWLGLVGPHGLRQGAESPGRVARDYRALRKAREDAKDEPGAADFYYGEMEMRRMARREEMWDTARRHAWGECVTAATEYALLWLYWAVSGYGLRAWRALTALVVMLVGAALLLRYAGFPPQAPHTFAASLRFAVQSAMSLLRGTDADLTPTGEWTTLALRLLGPLLFGLALLALRGRVRR